MSSGERAMRNPPRVAFCQYRGPAGPTWLCLDDLVDVVQTRQPAEVLAKLQIVEQAADNGLWAAGFLAYEAAPAMDDALRTHPAGKLPLAWFGLFRKAVRRDAEPEGWHGHVSAATPVLHVHEDVGMTPGDFSVGPWEPSVTLEQYNAAIDRIHDYIARGHTYQVNYTFRLRSKFRGDPWSLFRRLCEAQRGRYGAYLDIGPHVLCSASPELFFSLDGDTLLTRPMKGTIARGLTSQEDRQRPRALAGSVKDRAENAMVVDMMRNDLGRIAVRGSVRVASAFDVEKYPTVYQMTSAVMARTSASVVEIVKALFPSASVTGPPKVRTMEIIRELEPDCRGVYTGCIGWLGPGRKAEFNVAIRTVVIDRATGEAEYGVGGGIVWDSDKAGEYAECATKAAVLTAEIPRFELLETILYESGRGFFLLEKHLERLAESAEYFDFAVDLSEVRKRLTGLGSGLAGGAHRVRLLVGRKGDIAVESAPLPVETPSRPWRLRLAGQPVSSSNPFLYHKTTWRKVYDAAGRAPSAGGSRGDCDDVVLWNERGEVTETTIANLVVEKDGRLVTPPVSCGLLPGVFRAHLLETGQVCEEIVRVGDLRRAGRLFAVNSVRKWLPAVLERGARGEG
jgi:para-aminobenzoate synthetase/4-amino-4-deoxychorismate lyase